MTYKEYAEKAKEILQAIKNGNYEEEVDEPNFVREFKRDGLIYLVVYDNDGPTSSNDCGSVTYTICGEEFLYVRDVYGENTEVKSSFFDKAKNLENVPDNNEIYDIIDKISHEVRWLAPGMGDVESQAAAYAEANGITDYEALWYEEWDGEDDDEDDDY